MEVIFENADVRVSFEAGSGTSDEVVLAFTGARHALGGVGKDDFVRTNRSARIVRDAYYINDLRRRWYNGIRTTIVDVLSPRVEGRRVVTLGNSLGGFGALMFCGLFDTCDVAISFAPQYSVNKDLVPFEARWKAFTAQISQFESDSCFVPGARYDRCRKYIFCGADAASDVMHAALIVKAADANTHLFVVDGCGHDVSLKLKEAGILGRLVDAAIDGNRDEGSVPRLLSASGIAYGSAPDAA